MSIIYRLNVLAITLLMVFFLVDGRAQVVAQENQGEEVETGGAPDLPDLPDLTDGKNTGQNDSTVSNAGKTGTGKNATGKTRVILAVSWMPGFCEGRPKAAECRQQDAGRHDATHFTLHGLWSVGLRACPGSAWAAKSDTSGSVTPKVVSSTPRQATDKRPKWLDLERVALSPSLVADLATHMPGVVSGLDRYQWQRFGACSGLSAEDYFGRSLALLEAVNQSELGQLFVDHLGQDIGEDDINAALVQSFGETARGKIQMKCRKDGDRNVIVGLTFGLSGMPQASVIGGQPAAELAGLLGASDQTPIDCPAGIVDRAGFQ